MKKAYFITGTDTGVGKTLVACALLQAFIKQGKKAVGMKPVVAGSMETPAGLCYEDVENLLAAGNVAAPRELINPYALTLSIAPHIASAQMGVDIRLEKIEQSCLKLREMAEVVVVEGVGGFMVPLNDREDTADMAQLLGLPVIMVVGLRLGCLNHALLSAQEIRRRGLTLAGWVANKIDPDMLFAQDNIVALEQRLKAPLIGTVPYGKGLSAEEVARLLRTDF
ncbi:MAG: dethiobiotin synthase [Gammaproteobacteria bacterium]|nr:dethiobiotin synthase [Gammaproteobacteria bacterium]MBU1979550.1 dethiobiotin synthase [Gammaproteobacteria bacterium]